jgi:hypothetical protein
MSTSTLPLHRCHSTGTAVDSDCAPGIRQVFNSLNSLELKSLEEPRYLLGEFFKHPLACLTLASFLTTNSGDVARRHIKVGSGYGRTGTYDP